uniref:Palmitoyltransferase n=1 Tax=Pongo abelii TaxID=9601 RepID=A0A8I5T1X6_PONAB
MGGAGGAAPAPHLPAPGAGLPATLPRRVTHGPWLRECAASASGNQGPLLSPTGTQQPAPVSMPGSCGDSLVNPLASPRVPSTVVRKLLGPREGRDLQTSHSCPQSRVLRHTPHLHSAWDGSQTPHSELSRPLGELPTNDTCLPRGPCLTPHPSFQEELKEEQTAMVPPAIPLRRCRYCLVLQPLRARHCRECRRCVRRYDHHCPWMENCVGERNHPLFVVYLALQLVVLLWGLYLAWSGLRFFQPWGLWLRSSGLLFATFLLLSLFSLVASLLLASHLYLVASNTTTWEFISSHRITYLRQRPGNPFDRGLTRNLAHFFCGWPSGSWETLWAEEEEEGSSPAV